VSASIAARRGVAGLLGIAGLVALAGCPGGDSNPEVVWLTLDGDERHVRLVDAEPTPF
jgi:hypothetical protein